MEICYVYLCIDNNRIKGCCPFYVGASVVADALFIYTPLLGFSVCSLLWVVSSFAIVLVGKRELGSLLQLCPMCLVIVWAL